MSDNDPVELPDDVRALLDNERERPLPSPERAERVLARVLDSAHGGGDGGDGGDRGAGPRGSTETPTAAATSATRAASSWMLAGAFAAGALAGGGAMWTLRAPTRVVVERRVEVPGPTREVVREVVREVIREVPAAAPDAAVPRVQRVAASDPTADLSAERQLVEQASSAMLRSNYAAALSAVQAHARRFPHGALSEERDSLWVRALAGLGRGDEARVRAADFHRRHPDSMLGASVDRAANAR
ncbi:MAG: hypothetical protein U0326_21975 [Polyangiales bacterium]